MFYAFHALVDASSIIGTFFKKNIEFFKLKKKNNDKRKKILDDGKFWKKKPLEQYLHT